MVRDGELEAYPLTILGAINSSLEAISWFFDKPYETPAVALTPPDRAWVLGEASYGLRAQGRLQEALPAMRTVLHMEESAQRLSNAAQIASNLSETELLVGEVAAAVATAEQSVAHADFSSDMLMIIGSRTTRADAVLAAGDWKKSVDLLTDADQRQREWQPAYPLLYSMQGYRYCDLLLSQGRAAEVARPGSSDLAMGEGT